MIIRERPRYRKWIPLMLGLVLIFCGIQLVTEGVFSPSQRQATTDLLYINQTFQTVEAVENYSIKERQADEEDSIFQVPDTAFPARNVSLRSQRFPSVEERVKLYMADWYLPPCRKDKEKFFFEFKYNPQNRSHSIIVNHPWILDDDVKGSKSTSSDNQQAVYSFSTVSVQSDIAFSLDSNVMRNYNGRSNDYSEDIVDTMLPLLEDMQWDTLGSEPVLLQFGDNAVSHTHGYLPVPIIKKFRSSLTKQQLDQVTSTQYHNNNNNNNNNTCRDHSSSMRHETRRLEPIVWKLQTDRHLSRLPKVAKADTPWNSKLPQAIFRGALTGVRRSTFQNNNDDDDDDDDDPVKRCLGIPRCHLVYQHTRSNSTLLDAQLVNVFDVVPEVIDNVRLVGPRKNMAEQLQYKALVFLEGNDLSSGAKWGLFSRSVVLMPPPTVTSWVMEERLEPWVHYVPIRPDLSDVEEKIQWVLDHDAEAERIAQQATLWMYDLLFHPDAAGEEQAIFRQILQRYRKHFVSAPATPAPQEPSSDGQE